MSIPIEERLRGVLHEMADEVVPTQPRERTEAVFTVERHRRIALSAVAVAVVVAVVLGLGAVALLRSQRARFIEPVVRPPKVFRTTSVPSLSPGRSLVAVLTVESLGHRTMYLQPAAGDSAVPLAMTQTVPVQFSQQLSWDGTRVVRQNDSGGDPRLEILNLETGALNPLGGRLGYCPQLSPDNRTVAIVGRNQRLLLLDARDGSVLRRGGPVDIACGGIGWSSIGLLIVPGLNAYGRLPNASAPNADGSTVVDAEGRTVVQLPHRTAVNSGMSWSPDGRSVLLYDRSRSPGRYVIRHLTGSSESTLRRPADALRPLGWAGSRIVWLAGTPGDQRLLTTDQGGRDPRTWMRVVSDLPVETAQWSWDVSGRPTGER